MKLDFIPLEQLSVSKANMRWAKRPPDVSDILPTVRRRGVLQPVIVRPVAPTRAGPECSPGADGAKASHDGKNAVGAKDARDAKLAIGARRAKAASGDKGAPSKGAAKAQPCGGGARASAKACQGPQFEIVAGSRRFRAASIVAAERVEAGECAEPLPCAILDDGDEADAVEASLIENVARRDADEVSQWQTFTRLIKEGRSSAEIGDTFGLPDLAVRRVLALGNLLPRIRSLYAAEEIDAATVRHLTMATKARQKDWLALFDDAEQWAPTGYRLKGWLLGGQAIAASHALFDVEASGLALVADLFGEDEYFADPEAFWKAQDAEIEARRTGYIDAGWSDAVVVPPTGHFSSWEYAKAGKRKGGRVFIDVRASGEVAFHEGYISRKEAARIERGEETRDAKPQRPELTGPMQTYLDLHRHAAVRAELAARPEVALRLMVAHAITGSPLWSVKPEPQAARSDAIAESVEACAAEAAFDKRRRAVLALLGFDADEPQVTGGNGDPYGLTGLFLRLLALDDAAVLQVVAVVMGETLASGGAPVEAVGLHLGTAMAAWWEADEAFFALVRDKQVVGALVAEVAGAEIAHANADDKLAGQKAVVRDCLAGANGRDKVAGWVPRWMHFPPAAYTTRGGVGTVTAHAIAKAATEELAAADGNSGDEGARREGASKVASKAAREAGNAANEEADEIASKGAEGPSAAKSAAKDEDPSKLSSEDPARGNGRGAAREAGKIAA